MSAQSTEVGSRAHMRSRSGKTCLRSHQGTSICAHHHRQQHSSPRFGRDSGRTSLRERNRPITTSVWFMWGSTQLTRSTWRKARISSLTIPNLLHESTMALQANHEAHLAATHSLSDVFSQSIPGCTALTRTNCPEEPIPRMKDKHASQSFNTSFPWRREALENSRE